MESFTELSFIDGRAMRVGPCTKDHEAKSGRAPGGMAKGYKLRAWGTEDGRIPIWSVMPLNESEKKVAIQNFIILGKKNASPKIGEAFLSSTAKRHT